MRRILLGLFMGLAALATYSQTFTNSNHIIYTSTIVTNSQTNIIISFTPCVQTTDVAHVWWEEGKYDSNTVAKLVAQDQKSLEWNRKRVAEIGTNNVTIKWITPKFTWDMTNRVWWMKAHVDMTNAPVIKIKMWQEHGYVKVLWKEKLTDKKWSVVFDNSNRHFGIQELRIHMHPKSELTQKILNSNGGFFKGIHDSHIYEIDMSEFFPKPKVEKVTLIQKIKNLFAKPPSQEPPPIPK